MGGITIGQPWDDGDFKRLRIAGYVDDGPHRAALARVVNATRGTDWPVAAVVAYYGHPAFDLARDARLVWRDTEPVAAAICYPTIHLPDRPPGNFEIFVVPEARGHGLGSRLLAHLEQAAAARGHRVLETTIDQDDAPGRRFLRAHGFRVVAQTAHLTRPAPGAPGAPPLPDVVPPPGCEVRTLAGTPDAGEYYRDLSNRLGAYDPGYELIQPEDLAALQAGADWDPAGIFVLTDPEGDDVGVIRATAAGDSGFLHEIRIDPAYRGRNLGQVLAGTALAYLGRAGVRAVVLDTEGPDTPPYRLAVRCGFAEAHRRQQLLKPLPAAGPA